MFEKCTKFSRVSFSAETLLSAVCPSVCVHLNTREPPIVHHKNSKLLAYMRSCGATSVSVACDNNARHFIWSPTHSFLLLSSGFIPSHAKIGRDFYKGILLSHAKKHSVYCVQAKLMESFLCSLNEVLYEITAVKLSSTLFSHVSKVGSVSYQQRYNQMWSLVAFF